METLLTDRWMCGLDAVPTIDMASVSLARECVREQAASVGLDRIALESAALIASELATNQLRHARRGQIGVRAITREGVRGIEIVAADLGEGIVDVERAFAGVGPSAQSLGVGLSTVRRVAHELDVDVRMNEGTCFRARLFAERIPRRREIAILGRPCEGESVSGDSALFLREGDALLLAVADGLGHGPLARDASLRATDVLCEAPARSLPSILEASHAAITKMRGAVMAIVRIDESRGELEHASVGNVMARLERRGGSQGFAGSAATLGAPGDARRTIRVEHATIEQSDALILFTDGLSSRSSIADDPDLLRESAAVIAQRLLARFGRSNDDAMIAVVR